VRERLRACAEAEQEEREEQERLEDKGAGCAALAVLLCFFAALFGGAAWLLHMLGVL
jgi:hypothetical protein